MELVWQPDFDVTSCFLCHSTYTFFNRRHHCRKCGRVVCGRCSDQTIKYFPRTTVVEAEGNTPATSYDTYRTCDECVDEIRMIRRALVGDNGDDDGDTAEPDRLPHHHQHHHHRQALQEPEHDDNDSTTKFSTRTSTRMIRSSTSSLTRRRNEDERSDANLCPVCATDLLKLYINEHKKNIDEISNDDFEGFKESHISDCLVAYDFTHDDNERFSSPKARMSHPINKMLVFNMPPIPKPQFENIPPEEAGAGAGAASAIDNGLLLAIVGSVTSTATFPEKDPYDDECVICLEELKPGDKVARMECLCVFHYKCIKFWFKKKGTGECPVHFLHK